ncbi:NADP-dependent oxidoreductase [Acuticoccus sp. I52.16.1]|uniref:NADP-dependent oxidoreductase n=1 Tax=Acuticoccus sp. I52.16.1 TaxID=2928472 RepID=UPI00352F4FE6
MPTPMERIVLAGRPQGSPTEADFRHEHTELRDPAEKEVAVETLYLSLDPYMRGRMDDAKSYAKPVDIGATMEGGTVGRVIATGSDRFAVGDLVVGQFGWATHGVLPANQVRKAATDYAPPSASLGVLGMPGFTGWYGLTELGRPKKGETLVVGAATGPVGQMVGQLGKALGMYVVGVAGGADKCRFAVEELGFDMCVDHRAQADTQAMRVALAEACPDGIDVYYENVGGKVLEAVMGLMNPFGRIPVCGMVAYYNLGGLGMGDAPGPNLLPRMWRTILVNKLNVHGFIIMDHWERYGDFLAEVGPMVKDGRIKYREDITEGLANAPAAFMAMLKGENFGKTVVQVAEDAA